MKVNRINSKVLNVAVSVLQKYVPELSPESFVAALKSYNSDSSQSLANTPKKLTTAAFKRKSCPKWARYAAVNKSGLTYYFGWEPILGDDCWIPRPQEIILEPVFLGVFDASDWKNSLIKRHEVKK